MGVNWLCFLCGQAKLFLESVAGRHWPALQPAVTASPRSACCCSHFTDGETKAVELSDLPKAT